MYAKHTALVGLALLAGSVDAASSTCEFRFEGYLNISESPTWTLPAAEPYAENSVVLNEGAPFVYKGERDEEVVGLYLCLCSFGLSCVSEGLRELERGSMKQFADQLVSHQLVFHLRGSANVSSVSTLD